MKEEKEEEENLQLAAIPMSNLQILQILWKQKTH